MSRAVRVHLIAPSAVLERSECRYLKAVAQDSASNRGRGLPAKRAGGHLERVFQGPTPRTNCLRALRVKLRPASSSREPLVFAPARSGNGTVEFRPAGTCTLGCK